MRSSLLFLALALPLVAALPGPAQVGDRFALFSNATSTQPTYLYEIDDTGQLVSTIAALPANTIPKGLVVGDDNRTLIMPDSAFQLTNFVGTLLLISTNGQIHTLATSGPLDRPWHLLRDSDGDWLVLDAGELSSRMTKVIRMTPAGQATSFAISTGVSYSGVRDPDSGHLVVRGADGLNIGYLRIDPENGSVSSYWMPKKNETFWAGYGAREPFFEASTGAILDVPWDNGMRLARFHPEVGRLDISIQSISTVPVDAVIADQEAPAAYYVLGRNLVSPYAYHLIHLAADGTELRRVSVRTPSVDQRTTLVRLESRNLTWFMDRGPNGRSLRLSLPRQAGHAYVAALSALGVRPGLRLSDGRMIPLVVDTLTLLCLQGGIPGVIEGTVGTLDAFGGARVKVDTNAFGTLLAGFRFWAAAVVLDPNAPSGVSHVLGPTLLSIRR